MEHWGLITYRETSLLYDDRDSSSQNKQRVAAVVSHELAHMWFGNLGLPSRPFQPFGNKNKSSSKPLKPKSKQKQLKAFKTKTKSNKKKLGFKV